jgi:hypothetical protein
MEDKNIIHTEDNNNMKKYQYGGTTSQTNPILQQLESLNLTGAQAWQYSPEDIMSAVTGTYGITDTSKMNPAMFGEIGQQQMAMASPEYYNPMFAGGQQGFLTNYLQQFNKTIGDVQGGFAATSNVGTAIGGLRDVYGKNVSELLGKTTSMAQTQQENILKKIQGWKDIGRQITIG